ncbi:SDR family oxidoreductase [Rhizobium leguminosarum bv. viciae]|uniref:SDR family NAD(P)-dependent oxidoreductase n=1 Tax=Rhizobium leguminosarum TaxID=384 RepID=UPI001440F64C|nr:SDR family oxidoreductase [Rhizobium leguminosarum]NKJ94703.1 SDR family oxidoreductase [Rhizobium leguminosarum bv. viciae]NKK87483.1 SDR family oxidoreductase [Rhizobium leguminosarum bv. viciae]
MKRLEGKVALIAGAGRGIGRAAAKHLAAEGAKVAVLSLTPANIAAVVADIEAAGGTAIGVVCDVSDANRIKTAVESVAAAFGGIDVLVNAAFDPSVALSSVNELTVEQLQRNFDMGPIAYLRIMQAAHPYLKSSGAGRVINLGSAAGVLGMVNYAPYGMAKEAVRALTRVAAREWGVDGITVNTLMPIADTFGSDRPPLPNVFDRNGSPEDDIAPVIVFLATNDAQFITGSSHTPDGGMTIDAAR